jgi:hypothetical protein
MAKSRTGRVIRMHLGSIGPIGLKEPGSARATSGFEDPAWILARNASTQKVQGHTRQDPRLP